MKAAGMLGGATSQTYVDDVFSVWLRSGTGASATITNNIDLSTNGGLVWTKARSATTGHRFTDTARGATKSLDSSSTAAEATEAQGVTSFSTTGYVVGTDTDYNNSTGPVTYVDWTFRKAAKFFDVVTFTQVGTTGLQTVNHSLGQTPGMIIVKVTSTADNWYVYHRSSASSGLLLNSTAAGDGVTVCENVTSTSFDFNIGARGWANGATYVAYLFAHDTTSTGIIQCGSFTTDGSGNATVTLGWEIQHITLKVSSTTGNWITVDSMRGMPVGSNDQQLYPNLTNAETAGATLSPTATGFDATGLSASQTYIYLAIRRPNKPPTSGTQVYNAKTRSGNDVWPFSITGVGFAPDLHIGTDRGTVSGNSPWWLDRLRGGNYLLSNGTLSAINTAGATPYSLNMDGVTYPTTDFQNNNNSTGNGYVDWFFRRAPGVFDVVCDTGTGSAHTVSHNLGTTPELMIRKKRSAVDNWVVYAGDATDYLILNSTAATADLDTMWNDTTPTASVFTVGTNDDVNQNTGTFVTYLFATLAGISKVGSYTGNGSNQTINCGFSAGARFILIKRTDSTGDWYVYDTARGINAGNDPHLSLNTTAAEVNTTDDIDSDTSGFIVNQNATTNLNVNTATYIFWAVS